MTVSPCDVGRGIRRQEQRHLCDLRCRSPTTERHAREAAVAGISGICRFLRHARDGATWRQTQDAHTVRSPLDRYGACNLRDRRLAGRVDAAVLAAAEGGLRAHGKHHAAAARDHSVPNELNKTHCADKIYLDELAHLLDRCLEQGLGDENARIVDEHIDVADR